MLQSCDGAGNWTAGTFTLNSCGVVCAPNTNQCNGALYQTCQSNGTWNTGSIVLNKCNVVCTPGISACSGNQTESCNAVGQWNQAQNCPGATNATPTCAGAGICGFSCSAGFADCDSNPANGCEVNLSSDGNNCGSCGHGCCGSTCSASACQAGSTGITATHFDVDGTNLYWTDGSAINKAPKTALGSVTSLGTAQGSVTYVATNGSSVFWTDTVVPAGTVCGSGNGVLLQTPVGGGANVEYQLCSHPAWVSVYGQTTLSLSHLPSPGIAYDTINNASPGTGFVSYGGLNAWNTTTYYDPIVSDGASVYAIDASAKQATVWKFPIHGTTGVPFVQVGVNNTTIAALATDGTNLYWSYEGTPADGYADAGIYKKALTDATATDSTLVQLFTGGYSSNGNIGTDGTYVYYTQAPPVGSTGTFSRVSVGGGTPQAIASINMTAANDISRPIRFDSSCVFWSDTYLSAFRTVP